MILVGDKNNSSKQIACNEFNGFAPIKIGRSNNTASNVIKIFIGDSNNKAQELYFIPSYDWRGAFYVTHDSTADYLINVEVVAKYSEDTIQNRDPKLSHQYVDTLIFNQLSEDDLSYGAYSLYLSDSNYTEILNKYAPYVKNIILNTNNISYVGLCSTLNLSITYKLLEHIVINSKNIDHLLDSFLSTPNLKSVFIADSKISVNGSFNSHYDGCIILLEKYGNLNNEEVNNLQRLESPVLLVYECNIDSDYCNGLIEVNLDSDKSITSENYLNLYDSIQYIDNLIG